MISSREADIRERTLDAVEVIVAETALGRGIAGVIDGEPPLGVEPTEDVVDRMRLLREIGYKL
jgi:adenosine/AMP kinase